jgi:mRNA interferase MazF
MGPLAKGSVILVRFPFSDLSSTKLRPAVILAEAGRDDWILCQVTSNPYADGKAIKIVDADFSEGGLRIESYARLGKLFTANSAIFSGIAGTLKTETTSRLIESVIAILRA